MELEINKEVADITKCTRAALAFDYLAFCEKDYLVWCPLPASAFRYLTKNEISGAINRLVKIGYLTVEDSKTVDRRKKYTVTPSGIEALKTTKQI